MTFNFLHSANMAHLRPPSVIPNIPSIHPRQLVSLQPPPPDRLQKIRPQLPSPSRQPNFSDVYTLTTHIIPAAYPRVSPDAPLPTKAPESGIDKAERGKICARSAQDLLGRRQRHADHPLKGSDKLLWNCINRYVKKGLNNGNGLTLFFAHANGFPKEVRH